MKVLMKQNVIIEKPAVVTIDEYVAGEVYDLPEELANDFITKGNAILLGDLIKSHVATESAEETVEIVFIPEFSTDQNELPFSDSQNMPTSNT